MRDAPQDPLVIAFVQGAQWWEYQREKATMWPSDRQRATEEAEIRADAGRLGVLSPAVAMEVDRDRT